MEDDLWSTMYQALSGTQHKTPVSGLGGDAEAGTNDCKHSPTPRFITLIAHLPSMQPLQRTDPTLVAFTNDQDIQFTSIVNNAPTQIAHKSSWLLKLSRRV